MTRLILAVVVSAAFGWGVSWALGEPDKVPTGCEIYSNHLKSQRDTLEAQLANSLAEIAALKKAAEAVSKGN